MKLSELKKKLCEGEGHRFEDGFDAGAKAVMDESQKLVDALECNKTFHSLGGIDDCEPCKAKRRWKDFCGNNED